MMHFMLLVSFDANSNISSKNEVSSVITIAINTILFCFIFFWITSEIYRGRKSNDKNVMERWLARYLRWIERWKLRRWLLARQKSNSSPTENCKDNEKDSITVSNIFIYPVKSLRGISLQKTQLDKYGFRYDRNWMVVRPVTPHQQQIQVDDNDNSYYSSSSTHRFVSQRQIPSLAKIDVSLELVNPNEDEHTVVLSFEDQQIRVPTTTSLIRQGAERYQAGIWEDTVSVLDCGDEVAHFLASALGGSSLYPINSEQQDSNISVSGLRLVTMDPSRYCRLIKEAYTPLAALDKYGYPPMTSLTDGFPILLATSKSLEELNERIRSKKNKQQHHERKEEQSSSSSGVIGNTLPMSRFRPNIVLQGTQQPFEEDKWKTIRLGKNNDASNSAMILFIVKGCPRCKQSTTDQMTGEVDAVNREPLATLADFRKFGRNGDVFFAQNAMFTRLSYSKKLKEDVINVGDSVDIIETGDPIYE